MKSVITYKKNYAINLYIKMEYSTIDFFIREIDLLGKTGLFQ
jgi:hypothetical protein